MQRRREFRLIPVDGTHIEPKRHHTGTWVLASVVALIGIGNLVLTENAQALFPVDYLLLCSGLCGLIALYKLPFVGKQLPALLPLGVFLAGCIVGVFTSTGSDYAQNKYITFAIVCLVAAALAPIDDQSVLQRSLITLLFVASSAVSLLLLLAGSATSSGRFSLFDLNPIGLARVTGLSVLIAVAFLVTRAGGRRRLLSNMILVVVATLGLVSTVLTGSRGPLLSVGLAIVCMLLVTLRMRRLGLPSFLLLVAVAAVGYVGVTSYGGAGLDRLESGVESGRSELYSQTWQIIKAHPIGGVGWGSFPLYIFDFGSDDGTLYPHNILLELWVEGGVLALLGFLVLAGAAMITAYKAAQDTPSAVLIMSILIYSLANALVSSDVVGNRLMWISIVVALLSRSRSGTGPRLGRRSEIIRMRSKTYVQAPLTP